jgi:sulfur-carrier protein
VQSVGERGDVLVRYFAAAAEAAGREDEVLTLDQPATLGNLRSVLAEQYGAAMQRVMASGSFLVDGVVRRDPQHVLGSRVDVLPPFAGG